MAECRNCRIHVLDETEVCPLCRSILEQTEPMENMYPNVRSKLRPLRIISRIYLFCALLLWLALLGLNVMAQPQIWWSIIVGLGLLYGYLVLRYAIVGESGYRSKVTVLAILAVLMAIAIDFVVGYRGWSVDYVLPGGILIVDGIILGCMLFNRRRWHSYMMWQIMMILCSLIPAALYLLELEHNAYLAFLPLAVSAAIFLGTLIIGDRRARAELARRFHF